MTIVIFSIGQLISSNVQILKNNFQTALQYEGKNNSGDDVWNWMVDYLPRLRLNKISLAELCTEYNTQFSTSMSVENFTGCFNSMCEIDLASLARIEKLYDFLNTNPGIQFILVSHTNFSHLDRIMEQLEPIMPDCRDGIITGTKTGEQDAKMLFATSMYAQCERHPETLQWTIDTLEIDLNQPIISFLNTIQTIEGAEHFTYVPVNSNFDVDNVLEKINEVHVPGVRCGI